jgi:NAD(P)-dependent dehydrogenase (short-subunit alcohol dehydrogenase family)
MRREALSAEQIFSVRNRVAVVTGGANGLGFAYARALADNGARVTIFDIDRAASDAAVAELAARGGSVRGAIVELTDGASLRRAFDEVVAADGGLDVVFANAGVTAGPGFLDSQGARIPAGAIENIAADLWARVLDVNLTGIFLTIQAAVPHLKARQGGRIIVTTSTAATKTSPTVGAPYLATKAAIAHLVRQVAVELARFNILVNAIQPGPFLTRITTAELLPAFEQSSPSHRVGRTEEIEGLALFFASQASSFVTGAQYNIDGGQLLGRAD